MPNRRLTDSELRTANALLDDIRGSLTNLSKGDPDLLFAYRRKIYKELTYDERGKPTYRRQLKALKRGEQNGRCAICGNSLPDRYCTLDRLNAADGYTPENTRLICQTRDIQEQQTRGYT